MEIPKILLKSKTDEELAELTVHGNKQALEVLITRYQGWVYNLVLKMFFYPFEAEDITQEILIKVITHLSSFEGRSSFKTWLYRITVNHTLNYRKSLGEARHASTFEDYWTAIENTPDLELEDANSIEMRLTIEEVKISCMNGMLLCLDREQRLIFILAAIFGINDSNAAEIMELSNDNFRQKLSRARKQLYNFMNNKCGLINKSNPCSCVKKTKALINVGYVDPKKLMFNTKYKHSIEKEAGEKAQKVDELYDTKGVQLFREHPFQESPDFIVSLRKILESDEFKAIFNFN